MYFNLFNRFYFLFGFKIIRLFSGEEIWGVMWIWIFLFFFFDFLDKKFINSTNSDCEGQLSEINILYPQNPSIFY
jgi:quinol-cytochrome oxidoreductase complex cytochrome b subunit